MDHHSSALLRAGIGLGVLLTLVCVLATPAAATPQNKVTICHATSSVNNPYVQNTVNENAIVKPNGHGTHTGPVFPQRGWGDIIPSYEYNNDHGGTSIYPGLNWTTDGQAVWNAGCLVVITEPPVPPETTTTTSQPEVTTTTSGSTTTTAQPGTTTTQPGGSTTTTPGSTTTTAKPSGTTTTNAGSTTTTLPPTTTPTTAPPSELPPPITDPGGGIEIAPPAAAVVVDPGPVVVTLGTLSISQRVSLETEVDASAPPTTTTTQPLGPLPHTGLNVTGRALTALALILAGALLVMRSRRPSRRETK